MKAIKNFNAFKESLLSATNGNMVESFDSSNQFGGCEYQSYRVYVDDVHYYNMFVIYNFATNTYDVSLETSACAVSTMSRVCKTQKSLIESVVAWISCNYLNTKKIDSDSEEYTDRCTESEKHYYDYTSEDFIKTCIAPLPEQQTSEESIKGTVIADDTIAYQNARVKETKPTVLNVMQCMMCPADREGNRCGGKQWCKQTWKRYAAICNPEWHHVSLATIANIDRDMLDAKRQCYLYVYHFLKDFRKYAFETSRREVYFDLVRKVIKEIQQGYFNNKISIKAYNYACRHIESVSVEKNYFASSSEQAFGYKESKRYKITLR